MKRFHYSPSKGTLKQKPKGKYMLVSEHEAICAELSAALDDSRRLSTERVTVALDMKSDARRSANLLVQTMQAAQKTHTLASEAAEIMRRIAT